MFRSVGPFVMLAACAIAAGADDSVKSDLKKQARAIGQAVVKEDYPKIVEMTYPKVVELNGGRDKMIATMRDVFKKMSDQGLTFKSVEIDEPGDLLAEGKNTFVIVPTTTELTVSSGKIIARSYLLGISADGTKTWTFVDGSGLDTQEKRDKVLPKLPEKLELPEKQKPEFIRKD